MLSIETPKDKQNKSSIIALDDLENINNQDYVKHLKTNKNRIVKNIAYQMVA